MTGNEYDKEYKKAQLVENFNLYKGEEPATLRGYVEREADVRLVFHLN